MKKKKLSLQKLQLKKENVMDFKQAYGAKGGNTALAPTCNLCNTYNCDTRINGQCPQSAACGTHLPAWTTPEDCSVPWKVCTSMTEACGGCSLEACTVHTN